MSFEGIGYNDPDKDVKNEIVDRNDDTEKNLALEINKATANFRTSIDELELTGLENLNNLQLAHFLSATYFPGNKAKSYSECISGDKTTLEFSLRAALQLLGKKDTDQNKYDSNGKIVTDGSGKTIDERLMGENKDQGIIADGHIDETIVKILQAKVGATVDGKPGPQTISKVIYELGLDTEQIYAAVNIYYSGKAGGEKFTVGKIVNYPGEVENKEAILTALGNKVYKFDSSKFSFYYDLSQSKPFILPVGGQPLEVHIDDDKKLSLDGYSFGDDGLIRIGNNPNPSPDGDSGDSVDQPTDEQSTVVVEQPEINNQINDIITTAFNKNAVNGLKWFTFNKNGAPSIFAISNTSIRVDYHKELGEWYAPVVEGQNTYFYKDVKNLMQAGDFTDIFDLSYGDLLSILSECGDNPDYKNVGEKILELKGKTWRESNCRDLGKWCYDISKHGGKGFISFCEKLKGKSNFDVNDFTIGNRIGISAYIGQYDDDSIQFYSPNVT